MSAPTHDKKAILLALEVTGRKLDWPSLVEIVIAGGAAGILLGIWSADRVTEDCDIVEISPPVQPRRAILRAAQEAAEEIGLDPDWLNDHFMTFGALDTLPDEWRRRCVRIGTYGKLEVTCLGRQDLLAMKLYAGRPQDIQDIYAQIQSLKAEDVAFMRTYLESLVQSWRKNIKATQLRRAWIVLAELEKEVLP
jgi:hypothetical protein